MATQGRERIVFIRFQNPQGKKEIVFGPDEMPTASHEELKEMAKDMADPNGTRNIVECRVIQG